MFIHQEYPKGTQKWNLGGIEMIPGGNKCIIDDGYLPPMFTAIKPKRITKHCLPAPFLLHAPCYCFSSFPTTIVSTIMIIMSSWSLPLLFFSICLPFPLLLFFVLFFSSFFSYSLHPFSILILLLCRDLKEEEIGEKRKKK